jgi:hypothetical protein
MYMYLLHKRHEFRKLLERLRPAQSQEEPASSGDFSMDVEQDRKGTRTHQSCDILAQKQNNHLGSGSQYNSYVQLQVVQLPH